MGKYWRLQIRRRRTPTILLLIVAILSFRKSNAQYLLPPEIAERGWIPRHQSDIAERDVSAFKVSLLLSILNSLNLSLPLIPSFHHLLYIMVGTLFPLSDITPRITTPGQACFLPYLKHPCRILGNKETVCRTNDGRNCGKGDDTDLSRSR